MFQVLPAIDSLFNNYFLIEGKKELVYCPSIIVFYVFLDISRSVNLDAKNMNKFVYLKNSNEMNKRDLI